MSGSDVDDYIQDHTAGTDVDSYIQDHSLKPAKGFFNTIDSYTEAPIRAALSAAQNAKSTGAIIPDALSAGYNQLGNDTSGTPTFKDIAAKAGLSTQPILPKFARDTLASSIKSSPLGFAADTIFPGAAENIASTSPAGVAGVVGDAVGNPLNYLPVEKALGAVAKGAGDATDAVAGLLDKYAGTQAAKAIGMRKADMLKLIEKYGPDAVSKMGNDAMDMDTVPLFGTPKRIAEAADAAKDAAGKSLGKVIDSSQEALDQMGPTGMMQAGEPIQATPVRPGVRYGPADSQPVYVRNYSSANVPVSDVSRTIEKAGPTADILTPIAPRPAGSIDAPALAKSLRGSGDLSVLRKTPGMEGAAAQVDKFLDTLATNPQDMTLRDAQALRGRIDQSINYTKGVPDMAAAQQHLVTIRNAIGDAMSNAVDTAASKSGQDLGALKAANTRYSKAASISQFANDNLARQTANQAIGLTGKVAGAGGAAAGATIGAAAGPAGALAGEAIGGIGAAGAEKAARTLGPAFLANTSRGAANMVRSAPGLAQSAANLAGRALPPIAAMTSKGPDAWAQSGLKNLGIEDETISNRLLSDPKAKQLLIQASSFPPGSKGSKNIMQQLQKGWGAQ
jgi:hypothetical protein